MLRRSLGKERSAEAVDSHAKRLYDELIKNGVKEGVARDVLTRTQGFSSYGFPEAHAASYGQIAFISAYLKAHHPAEFLCALINSQPMGYYAIKDLIKEAKLVSGVTVLPIHPNKSHWDAIVEGHKTLRMGFRDVRKVRQDEVEELVEERNLKPFKSIEDFIFRTNFERDVLENLNLADAFECFGLDRRHSFWKSSGFTNLRVKSDPAQLSLFDEKTIIDVDGRTFRKMTELEEGIMDHRLLGYSLNGSLMKPLRLELPHLPSMNSALTKLAKHNSAISIAGIVIVDQRPPPAKGFGFLTLEDEFGTFDLILRPQIYDQFKPVFRSSRFLIIDGRIQRAGTQVTILVTSIESFAAINKVRSHQPHPRLLDRPEWIQ